MPARACAAVRPAAVDTGVLALFILIAMLSSLQGATLEVGPGKAFSRIEDANAKAATGDTILVYPLPNGAAYERVAVFVRTPGLTFKAVPAEAGGTVPLSGQGFDYSGQGSVPRAIFQFNRGADKGTIEGFELSGAHNSSHNGAGVRINQANQVSVLRCHIHDNDMGVMSNGDGTADNAAEQLFSRCRVHDNGNRAEAGYNHNFYLGGASATLTGCEVFSPLTGHNVKSRVHLLWVQYCYVHDSANREFDLVDAAETERPGSHAVLLGNLIVKDPKCPGNHGLIHFGQDGKHEHDGTLFLVHNTIVTPFQPVLELSAPKALAQFTGNYITAPGGEGRTLAVARAGADLANLSGARNWFDRAFVRPPNTGLTQADNTFGQHLDAPFVDPARHDYRPAKDLPTDVLLSFLKLPAAPGAHGAPAKPEPLLAWQYQHPATLMARPREEMPTLGALARTPAK